jgi:hypothetical protein
MTFVSFGDYEYIPVLATNEVERIAYAHLRPDTVAGILPLFELTRHRGGENLEGGVALVQGAVTLPFFLDLDKRFAPPPYQAQNPGNPVAEQQRVARETQENDAYNAYLNSLLSPASGFANWRDMCSRFGNAVPVLQYTNPTNQANAILRQASLLSQDGNCIALRITQTQSDTLLNIAVQILATLPSSGQLMIILDCGQGRRGVSEKADWVLNCLGHVVSRLEPDQMMGLAMVCMSNSYPPMNHDGLRITTNCDRQIWLAAYDQFPFHFGDYAASTRNQNLSAFLPRSFRATVVHSLDDSWVVHRHENADDPQGWIVGSQVISAHESFDPTDSWTDQTIEAAANGDLTGMGSPRPWHATRIAGHIDRQFRYQPPVEDIPELLD